MFVIRNIIEFTNEGILTEVFIFIFILIIKLKEIYMIYYGCDIIIKTGSWKISKQGIFTKKEVKLYFL